MGKISSFSFPFSFEGSIREFFSALFLFILNSIFIYFLYFFLKKNLE